MHRIRKYLSSPGSTPNHVQYNAIMLMRILADNPGHSFTRNFDSKFCTTIKELLRNGRDWHVQHYLRQYLAQLEATRHWDDDLQLLLQVWAKEKAKGGRSFVSAECLCGLRPEGKIGGTNRIDRRWIGIPQPPRQTQIT